ncbi:nuclease-related domain-containing protein [Oceanobacillus halophilus]|uniref:NERD domain-containing protein n=1 Tax=Oceanobacillus halophilus TaxID=930130 RepID=A0A495A1F9_9BACI|nr:nuclease-related domain-containing protein [Oceanobacillus halophilus]RKQ31562.1 NERD domain-containing protein [Oceanobacillus halophilus]
MNRKERIITIIKERDKEKEIMRLEALNRRTPASHPEKENVSIDLKKKYSEVNGEKQVDYSLGFLDEQKYLELHNLRLEDDNGFFQIDSLLMSAYFNLDVEVKNWLGTVIFGQNGQVTRRTQDGKEEGFDNPVSQAKTQVYRLQKWLHNHGFPQLPTEYLVDISYPKTIITSSSPNINIPHEVIHNNELLFRIQKFEEKYNKKMLPTKELLTIANALKEAHVPPEIDLLEKYQMSVGDLIRGVFCTECGAVPMDRDRRKWFCQKCKCYSNTAHIPALNDLKLIVGDFITNRQLRYFLKVDSADVIKRIMKKEGYSLIGSRKQSKYRIKLKI